MRSGILIGIAIPLAVVAVVVWMIPVSPGPVRLERVPAAAPPSAHVAPSASTVAMRAPASDILVEANRGDTRARSQMCANSMASAAATDNFKDAAYWCALAAEAGDGPSQSALARLYQLGTGVVQDDAQAAFWYEQAILQRDAHAMYMRGRMLIASSDAADYARGHELLEQAAALGDPSARWELQEAGATSDLKEEPPRTLIR